MTGYEVLVLLHVLAAITWVGGGITINVLLTRVLGAGEGTVLAGVLRQLDWMGNRVFLPSGLAVLGLGIAMVAVNEAWTIGQLWIVLSLIGIGITIITGAAFFGPEGARVQRLIDERGADDPEVRRRVRRLTVVSRLDLLVLILIVADMVLKPGL